MVWLNYVSINAQYKKGTNMKSISQMKHPVKNRNNSLLQVTDQLRAMGRKLINSRAQRPEIKQNKMKNRMWQAASKMAPNDLYLLVFTLLYNPLPLNVGWV